MAPRPAGGAQRGACPRRHFAYSAEHEREPRRAERVLPEIAAGPLMPQRRGLPGRPSYRLSSPRKARHSAARPRERVRAGIATDLPSAAEYVQLSRGAHGVSNSRSPEPAQISLSIPQPAFFENPPRDRSLWQRKPAKAHETSKAKHKGPPRSQAAGAPAPKRGRPPKAKAPGARRKPFAKSKAEDGREAEAVAEEARSQRQAASRPRRRGSR